MERQGCVLTVKWFDLCLCYYSFFFHALVTAFPRLVSSNHSIFFIPSKAIFTLVAFVFTFHIRSQHVFCFDIPRLTAGSCRLPLLLRLVLFFLMSRYHGLLVLPAAFSFTVKKLLPCFISSLCSFFPHAVGLLVASLGP